MNTARYLLRGIGMVLAVFILAHPAVAQEEAEADTLYLDGQTIVIEMNDDDGRRIIIRGLHGDEQPHVFTMRPGRRGFVYDFDRLMPRTEFKVPRVEMFERLDPDHLGVRFEPLDEMNDVFVGRLGDFTMGLHGSMEERAEIARMEQASRRLAREARRAEGEERARLERELEEQLNEIFDRKQALRLEHVEALRKQLDEVQAEHDERGKARQEIVERRLRDLLGQRDRHDW